MDGAPGRRFPARVFSVGEEPDARFSLANERTFLAWIRTALALLASGVALEALQLGLHPTFRLAASLLLVVGGLVAAVQAWLGWARTERALRANGPLPPAAMAPVLVVVVVVAAVLVVLGILVP